MRRLTELHPAPLRITRRGLLSRLLALLTTPAAGFANTTPQYPSGPDASHDALADASAAPTPWFWRYPTFAQTDDATTFESTGALMDIHGMGSDPTWGPYAQQLRFLEAHRSFDVIRKARGRVISWIEGFGDCMLYAITVERRTDGTFVTRQDDPHCTRVFRSHWAWDQVGSAAGNTFRWVGIHNTVNNEDFVAPRFSLTTLNIPLPRYPDGRPATGWRPGLPYPLAARVYDACGSKDISGHLHPAFEATTSVANRWTAGRREGSGEGLLPAIPGADDVGDLPGRPKGEPVFAGVVSIHKDLSAPFWREYVRHSVRELLQHGLDGVWCDNYSPWDNFGYPPVQKAFGDWSVAGFHHRVLEEWTAAHRKRIGISDAAFDVRSHLKAAAEAYGAKDAGHYDDPAWRDTRWLNEPVWCAYRAYRQQRAQADLKSFYDAIHAEARLAGRPDFCIGGNDIPFYGLGWVRDDYLDMVNTELTPGWHMGTGSRGVMTPPHGKMAVVYRLALEHQKGPICAGWYYLNGDHARYAEKPALARVLLTEAFANGAVLMCAPDRKDVAGSRDDHAWLNHFVSAHRDFFGVRHPVGDVGVLFSPDAQLALLAPGGFPNLDHQPHVFGFYGWCTVLIDAHIPYRVVVDWKLDHSRLSGLHTLILPDAECLDAAQVAAISEWVHRGGRLILNGQCGTRARADGNFLPWSQSLLSSLSGHPPKGSQPVHRQVGRGTIHWTADSPGMKYYLSDTQRPAQLSELTAQISPSQMLQAPGLPSTVGITLWRARDSSSLFVDLVNYDIDTPGETLRPARGLVIRVHHPGRGVSIRAVAPDPVPAPSAARDGNWIELRLPELHHYASIRLQ